MPDAMNVEDMITIIEGIVKGIDKNVEYLTNLDQAIGDGDHGITLRNGFKVILDRIGELKGKDAGKILETVGHALISNVGGAAGPPPAATAPRATAPGRGAGALPHNGVCPLYSSTGTRETSAGGWLFNRLVVVFSVFFSSVTPAAGMSFGIAAPGG